MKKARATEDTLVDQLKGSAFFKSQAPSQPPKQSEETEPKADQRQKTGTIAPSHRGTNAPMYQSSMVQTIRQAVRQAGKEAANYRFSDDEKQALNDIKHAYKRRKINTSDNQIARIGINFLVEDYRQNGGASLLAQVLEELNK